MLEDHQVIAVKQEADERGKADGKAAASWVFDGNTTDETYRYMLKGIREGDGVVLDKLPYADFSGEWAGSENKLFELVSDCLWEAGITDVVEADDYDSIEQEVMDAYSDAFAVEAQLEVERLAVSYLGTQLYDE